MATKNLTTDVKDKNEEINVTDIEHKNEGVKSAEPDIEHKKWWQDPKRITILASIIAAIMPAMTLIDGGLRSFRDYSRSISEQQDKIRQAYLDRALRSGLSAIEQQRIYRLLARLDSDRELQQWANDELERTNSDIKTLEEEKKRKTEETTQKMANVDSVNKEIIKLENKLSNPLEKKEEIEQKIKEQKATAATIVKQTKENINQLALINEQLGEPYTKSSKGVVYIQFQGGIKREMMEDLRTQLNLYLFAPEVERVKGNYKNIVRFFHPEDQALAEDTAAKVENFFKQNGCEFTFQTQQNTILSAKVPTRQIEVWINGNCQK